MNKKNNDIGKVEISNVDEKKITRKQALKKTGLIALSAATMMMLISTPKAAHASPGSPEGPTTW